MKQTITLSMAAGNNQYYKQIEASVKGGLAVHHPVFGDFEGCGWQITHVPSGLAIGESWFETRKEAKAVRTLLLAALDWDRPCAELREWFVANPESRREVRRILGDKP